MFLKIMTLSVQWCNNKVEGPVALRQLSYHGYVRLDQDSNQIHSEFHT